VVQHLTVTSDYAFGDATTPEKYFVPCAAFDDLLNLSHVLGSFYEGAQRLPMLLEQALLLGLGSLYHQPQISLLE